MTARTLSLLAGLLASAVFAWLALADVRWMELRSAFTAARLWLAVPFVLSLTAFYWLKAVRWQRLLAPTADIPAGALVPSLMVGFAANNVLPAHLGELVRVYLLGRERGLARSAILGTVVLERAFDLVAVLLLGLVALAAGSSLGTHLRAAGVFLALVALAALAPAALLALNAERFLQLVRPLLRRLPERLSDRILGQLAALASGFGALRARHEIAAILVNSLVQWALLALCAGLAIAAFGLDVPWVAAIVVLVLIVAGITLPSGPGYIGTIEYCFVLGLKAFGVGASAALSAGLFYHALTWGYLAFTGAWFLKRYGMGWRSLGRAAAQS